MSENRPDQNPSQNPARDRSLPRAERFDPYGENDYGPDSVVTYEYTVAVRADLDHEDAEVDAMALIRAERLDPEKFAVTPVAQAGYTIGAVTSFISMACWLAETPSGIPGFHPIRANGPYTDPDDHPVHLFAAELGVPGEDVLIDWVWVAGAIDDTWPGLLDLIGFEVVKGEALNFDGDVLDTLKVPARTGPRADS